MRCKNNKTGTLFFVCFCFSKFSLCQLLDTSHNIPVRDTVRYHLSVLSAGSWNQTKSTNTYLLNNAVRVKVTARLFSMNIFGSYLYGKTDQALTNNDVFTSVDGNFYQKNSKFFYWLLVNYTSSYSLKINGLFQGGAGVAYNFINQKENYLNLSDGVLYEKDDLYIDTLHDIYNTYRNSFRLTFKWTIVKNVIFEGSNFLQNSFSNRDDYIVKSNLSFSFNLYKWLSLTSVFVYNRFNRTGQQNLLLNYGLKIEKDL